MFFNKHRHWCIFESITIVDNNDWFKYTYFVWRFVAEELSFYTEVIEKWTYFKTTLSKCLKDFQMITIKIGLDIYTYCGEKFHDVLKREQN